MKVLVDEGGHRDAPCTLSRYFELRKGTQSDRQILIARDTLLDKIVFLNILFKGLPTNASNTKKIDRTRRFVNNKVGKKV